MFVKIIHPWKERLYYERTDNYYVKIKKRFFLLILLSVNLHLVYNEGSFDLACNNLCAQIMQYEELPNVTVTAGKIIKDHIDNGRPIIIAVDEKPGTSNPWNPADDKYGDNVSDHFLLVTGYDGDCLNNAILYYAENGTGYMDQQFSDLNTLIWTGDHFEGDAETRGGSVKYYKMTQIRPNN